MTVNNAAAPAAQATTAAPATEAKPAQTALAPAAAPFDLEGAIPFGATTAEAKPVEPAPADQPATPEEEAFTPESYQFELPEGFQVDDEGMNTFKTWLAGKNIAPEAAGELMTLYQKQMESFQAKVNEQYLENMRRIHNEGYQAIMDNPELGGENFQRSRMRVARALAKFANEKGEGGDNAFAEEMKKCGMSNNPHLFQFLARVGDWVSEAEPLASDATSPRTDVPISQQWWGFVDKKK